MDEKKKTKKKTVKIFGCSFVLVARKCKFCSFTLWCDFVFFVCLLMSHYLSPYSPCSRRDGGIFHHWRLPGPRLFLLAEPYSAAHPDQHPQWRSDQPQEHTSHLNMLMLCDVGCFLFVLLLCYCCVFYLFGEKEIFCVEHFTVTNHFFEFFLCGTLCSTQCCVFLAFLLTFLSSFFCFD